MAFCNEYKVWPCALLDSVKEKKQLVPLLKEVHGWKMFYYFAFLPLNKFPKFMQSCKNCFLNIIELMNPAFTNYSCHWQNLKDQ